MYGQAEDLDYIKVEEELGSDVKSENPDIKLIYEEFD